MHAPSLYYFSPMDVNGAILSFDGLDVFDLQWWTLAVHRLWQRKHGNAGSRRKGVLTPTFHTDQLQISLNLVS